MKFCVRTLIAVAALTAATAATPLVAQEIALKGGIAVSRFQTNGPFDGSFVSTAFGGHARFGFGPIALQPELQMVSRGARATQSVLEERMRLEYMELPLMIVVPVRVGSFEPYAFGGPMLSLETRCRSTIEQDDLKTNFECSDRATDISFDRRAIDYGISAGAGVAHKLGSGRILLEGRHTWGMRDIYNGAADGIEVRNRSFIVSIGYTIVADELD
ncbi:MAG: PorT family protein [Gemmatimonadetes bacterium]|nr:PorT family protein [Gemmatimonadota bacterium]